MMLPRSYISGFECLNMKKIIRSVISLILFAVLLVCSTSAVSDLLRDRVNTSKYDRFYSEKEDFDVLFFGSSRVLDGVAPMQLWKDYGIRSYNMAQHNENVLVSYWQLKNALNYQTPKVVFFDVSLFSANIVTPDSEKGLQAYLHKSLDHMPFGITKIQAVNALTDGYDLNEYLFPLAIYHNRWSTLDEEAAVPEQTFMGGEDRIKLEYQLVGAWDDSLVLDRDAFNPDLLGMNDVIELCREHDVDVVFTCVPAAGEKNQSYFYPAINGFAKYFEEKGVPFLNFCRDDLFINGRTDYADGTHLNPSGSRKLTQAFGEYLVSNYTFDEPDAETKAVWDEDYEKYVLTRTGEILGCIGNDDVYGYLMLISGTEEFSVKVLVPSEDYDLDRRIKNFLFDMGFFPDSYMVDPTSDVVLLRLVDLRSSSVVAEMRLPAQT